MCICPKYYSYLAHNFLCHMSDRDALTTHIIQWDEPYYQKEI